MERMELAIKLLKKKVICAHLKINFNNFHHIKLEDKETYYTICAILYLRKL